MVYMRAEEILPEQYVDGESIYIPDNENAWRKRPVKSRVCGTWTCKLQQIYNNFTTHNEE